MLDQFKSLLGSSMSAMGRFLARPIQVSRAGLSLGLPKGMLRGMQRKAREEERERNRKMQNDLHSMLEQHPSSRKMLRHLALVERTLRRGGFDSLEALPVRVIAKALAQMEQLVWDWSPVGLAELRSRMAQMVKRRKNEREGDNVSTDRAELDVSGRADVTEVDHETYEEMERSWSGQMPVAVAEARRSEGK